MDDYCAQNDVEETYVMEIANPPKRIIDASAERCPIHVDSKTRCLGRLLNHATQKNRDFEANLKTTEIVLDKYPNSMWNRVAVFVARRDIKPLEQLRYDYGDPCAN